VNTLYEHTHRAASYIDEMGSTALKDRLADSRRAAELSQSALARLCGVDPSAINKLESGSTKTLSGELLVKISAALSVEAQWLATGNASVRKTAKVEPIADPSEIGEVVSIMRTLSASSRGMILGYAQSVAEKSARARKGNGA
jgi:transcriptional regulator with XRE-family HTH domain